MASKSAKPSNSGIRTNSSGDSIIPSSTRADGSVRREIRVKPGYKPPEDVEVYKNRTAEAWKNRGKGGVPGASLIEEQNESTQNSGSNKNAKRREARKRAAALANVEGQTEVKDESNCTGQSIAKPAAQESSLLDTGVPSAFKAHDSSGIPSLDVETDPALGVSKGPAKPEADQEAEKAKEARKLTKKLRQARELREKEKSGSDLLPEQFAKVIKINELIRQLASLGFDADGERLPVNEAMTVNVAY